jgi:hypothetical protein
MTKPSDHIEKGARCVACDENPATTVTRLVARDDGMPSDALLWGAATCWSCAEALGRLLDRALPTGK